MALLMAKTESGLVEGLPANNQVVSIFKGVPFAKAERWRAPERPDSWEGVYQAFKFAPICPQAKYVPTGPDDLAAREFYVHDFEMSEDCLYLNIWTPAKSADEKLPVAMYIHGGGFETGFSYLNAYDGEGFAKRGVIMVSIAYRTGIWGYFAHPELAAEDPHGSTGNYGTMDQLAALEWIHRNIAAFGGDPEHITIFGQSAGGMSVQHLCNCPQAKGLFVGAIMQSCGGLGAAGNSAAKPVEHYMETGKDFLKYLGVNSVAEARGIPTAELQAAFEAYKGPGYTFTFIPCIDGYLMPEAPCDYFRAGKQPDVPYMLGCTADDLRNWGAPAPSMEKVRADAQEYGDWAGKYLALVPEDEEGRRDFYENRTAEEMLAANKAWCENQLMLGRQPAYEYYFTYVPPMDGGMGAYHSVEHHYVFQTLLRSFRPYTGFDYDLSNELADYWANFMKYGNPNGEGPQVWKPYTKEAPEALIIARERHMAEVPERPYVTFQKELALR